MSPDLTSIPGVGKHMAAHLNALGIERVDDLKGQDPEALYARECAQAEIGRASCRERVLMPV